MRGRGAEATAIVALASIVTVAMAAFVIRAPSERVFGMEIVGRHHDPFTVMEQFERPVNIGVYSQPVTDLAGALLARLSGAVAAYNWLVLLSFPLSAAAAYLLARHLTVSPAGAAVAAIVYAFSPFHVAHAAYHPHIAQTQWLPLYLLALWRCLDRASPGAIAFLGAAAIAVTLSNFYGGFIAAVITPVAVVAYWLVACRRQPGSVHRLGITVGSLIVIAGAGIVYASYAAGAVVTDRAAFAFPRADLFLHSAKWWSYLVPPIAHPMLDGVAHRVWSAAGVGVGLLEHQVYLGWGVIALAIVAMCGWFAFLRGRRAPSSLAAVPALVIVAIVALLCSLSPERTIGSFTFVRPSALLYAVAPMFRSYARFGVVVQLMAALLAGIGVDWLRRSGTARAQLACVALLMLATFEYAVSPHALWRDTLPTTAHRWLVQRSEPVFALDCTPATQESASVRWLTDGRVTVLDDFIADCAEPNLAPRLAAARYTHLLVRHDSADREAFSERHPPDGLRLAARAEDGLVFAVVTQPPAIYTAAMTGFSPREREAKRSWRWMGVDGAWTVVATGTQPIVATLGLEISAFHRARRLDVRFDRRHVQTLVIEPERRVYAIGPLTVVPGDHELTFHPADPPTVAHDVIDNGDRRPLSFAIGAWTWTVRSELP
jgi:hypothetical protein